MKIKSQKAALLLLVFPLLFTCATAQVNSLSTKLVCKNDTATWIMEFMIEDGYYVYAPDDPSDDGGCAVMEITWSNISDKLQPGGKIIWPPSTFHDSHRVFTAGKYTVQQTFIIKNKGKKTPVIIEGKLLFQGCNEDRCYPPQELVFKTPQ